VLLGSEWSALSQGDVLEAFAAFGRDGWTSRSLRARAKVSSANLLHAVTRFDAERRSSRATPPLVPRPTSLQARCGRGHGGLLIRSEPGSAGLKPVRSSEGPLSAEAGTPSWPLELVASRGCA